jgi:hypothetical protein
VPKHAGLHPGIGLSLGAAIARLHQQHPTWSYQLHYDPVQAPTLCAVSFVCRSPVRTVVAT